MSIARFLAPIICAGLLAPLAAAASHLVTGNGFGFAVVSPETGTVTKFYAHPYSFVRPNSRKLLGEGVETANFIQEIGWADGIGKDVSAEYEDDSHVIHTRRSDGEGLCFMPFGLRHTVLILNWEPSSAEARRDALHVKWSRPISSQRAVQMFGMEMRLLKFDGI